MNEPTQPMPPLSAAEYASLKQSIAEHGVLVPVVVDAETGALADGHHRRRAATEIGVECPEETRSFASDAERIAYGITVNVERRHLSFEQLREVRARQRELYAELRAEGRTQAQAAEAVGVTQGAASQWESSGRVISSNNPSFPDSRLTIPRDERPVIAERLEAGESAEAVAADYKVSRERIGQIGRQEQARQRQHGQGASTPLPDAKFRAIVIDPPWPMDKIEREERPDQGDKLDYPTMSLEEIGALDVPTLAADGCHVYLWTTHRFLPAALEIFAGWGARYQCLMTWVKNVGITPFSWMYDTEHVVFGRIGSLPLERKGLRLSFSAPITRHSAKPDVFYERVTEASPGPRLEMFAREAHEGFDAWGNEVQAG